jgi:2-polyprenyl-3-methyl-5-hydroxy-6-metoxy-1,4-benzoquinol methylase
MVSNRNTMILGLPLVQTMLKKAQGLLLKNGNLNLRLNKYNYLCLNFTVIKSRYFEMQRVVTHDDIIPFIEQNTGACSGKRVLEIGCAEAGVLKAFIEKGNIGTGVELAPSRYESAKLFLKQELEDGRFFIINKNIYDINDPTAEFGSLFDIIVLKDVIEHIPDQPKFINRLKLFLKPQGVIFFAYPPWWMPFGGHQQLCVTKLLEKLPWFHLLP